MIKKNKKPLHKKQWFFISNFISFISYDALIDEIIAFTLRAELDN